MSLAARKLAELDGKLAGIEAELRPWLADTREGRPLRKHRTQLLRITDTLQGLVDRMATERAALAVDDADVLDECKRLQEGILEFYRLWEFFRSKFALRYHGNYREFLALADEFAWACYRPALDLAVVTHRPKETGVEPPLVYFSGDFSPFAHPRHEQFDVEGPDGVRESDAFLRVLRELPVPVIGLPWYQLDHLPDLLLLAHEVGHCVEADFRLGRATERHVGSTWRDVPPDRLTAWRVWSGELFADCFATVVAGPAYVGALADFLA
ncbi:MAG: hypothetical protein HOV94_24840, partial [Saccharothrix sp.]|nr:hypothetical protein [Saccharothrix sp.]